MENNWEPKEEFSEYMSTLNKLNNEDKAVPKNFTHFTTYVGELLITHFKRLTKDVLFLSLFSNQPTKSLVE